MAAAVQHSWRHLAGSHAGGIESLSTSLSAAAGQYRHRTAARGLKVTQRTHCNWRCGRCGRRGRFGQPTQPNQGTGFGSSGAASTQALYMQRRLPRVQLYSSDTSGRPGLWTILWKGRQRARSKEPAAAVCRTSASSGSSLSGMQCMLVKVFRDEGVWRRHFGVPQGRPQNRLGFSDMFAIEAGGTRSSL